ncbi:hypothetical protein Syun_007353 [Stephania yunnanensis]|uniref:Uncharacterized protein n=1 Tax=Stephania yunnanensis TaxID=152371 RepID=A0AAP0L026_9MAGN
MEFRSLEGQEMYTGDKIVPLKDSNNFDSDPEEFARTLCKDLDIRDAEVALESINCTLTQLLEIPLFAFLLIRERKEWDLYEPIVDLLSNEEVETLDAREERNAR